MIRSLLFALIIVAGVGEALAQTVYRWVDHEGRVHLGHSVPPEYRALGYDRLAPDGRVLESVPPELTPEERAAERERRRRQAEIEAEEADQAARDRLLLAAYASEEAIIESRDMRLGAMQQQRRALNTSHRHAVERFEDLVARAADLNRQGRAVPDALQTSIAESRAEIRRLRRAIEDMDARMIDVTEQFELELERYRALTQSAN